MTPWTPAEDAVLLAEFSITTNVELAAKLGRSFASVKNRAIRLGLKKTKEHRAKQAELHSRALTAEEMKSWLLENVRIDGDCRIWAGSTNGGGYPEVMWSRKRYSSRRLLGQLLGMCRNPSYACWTSCGNRLCMAPEHLRFGTRKQIGLAMRRHGVYLTGSQRSLVSCLGRAPKAKLPITERRKVMALRAQGYTLQQIASVYGVHFDTVSKAIRAWNRALGQPVDFG